MKLRIIACAVLALGWLTAPVFAATYYTATSGNDSRTCVQARTSTTPKQTINSALPCLAAGDTLLVRVGTYNEALVNPALAGTSWANKIRIAAYPGETVWLTPQAGVGNGYAIYLNALQQFLEFDGINVDGSNTLNGPVKIEGDDATSRHPDHIRLQNLEIVGTTAIQLMMGIEASALVNGLQGFNEFLNLKIHHTGSYGMYVNSSDNLIDHCEIYDNGGAGLHISNSYNSGDNRNVLRNNRIHDITRFGSTFNFQIWGIVSGSGSPSNNQIYNNVIYNMGGSTSADAGIYVFSGNDNAIWNNTVYGGTGAGIVVGQVGNQNTIIQNNIAYANAVGNYVDVGTGTIQNHNLFGVNPLFANVGAANFQIQAGSLARDAGVMLGGVATDILGIARPQGSAPDIGAYEFGGSTPPSAPTGLRIVS
jgi:hypothetical protein